MKTSPEGIKFIQSWEALRLKRYLDPNDGWTIGWGHLIKKEESIPSTITKETADKILTSDLAYTEGYINQIGLQLTQNQFDALVSFVFNIGTRAFRRSTLYKLLLQGSYREAAKQFKRWRYDNGKVVEGLLKRRVQETNIFTQGFYTYTH
jgi:lysozyme